MNLTKSKKLQIVYYNKYIKKCSYRLRKSIQFSDKHIKTKRKLKLKYKYLGLFQIFKVVGKQAYRLKLHMKWCIYPVFYVQLLERHIIRREMIDQKITDQLEFEKGDQSEQEIDLIIDSMIFIEEAIDGKSSELYYFIH